MATRRGLNPHTLDPVPPDNEPGHHPAVEQDKPLARRPRPRTARRLPSTGIPAPGVGAQRFPMAFIGRVGTAARLVVLHQDRAYVDVTDQTVTARFGTWVVTTPRSNVAGASITGPYRWWKVAGPPHLTFSDKGLTFATNDLQGVRIDFEQPVTGMEFTGRLRHPNLTVTVADPQGLIDALGA